MVPPDRPILPYSAEDVQNMTDPQEQKRAMAELSSFIVRMKKWKEQYGDPASDSEIPQVMTPFGGTARGHGVTAGNDEYQDRVARPQRGGYSRSRGGRGSHSGYHPYQRPAYHANRSVVFNNPNTSNNASNVKKPVTPIKSRTPEEDRQQQAESKLLCPAFTSTGVCSRHACRRAHDPDKQAICKTWLFKGSCPKGDACALSHKATPHNAPTCLHFQEARCNNDNCRFSHVRINPGALNCEAFGILGYCEKGAECFQLHAHECPTFSNTGSCYYGDNCRYGHVRRASRLRKAAHRSSEGLSSPPATTDNGHEDSGPAKEEPETLIGPGPDTAARDPHHFTQQADFVSLSE